MYIGSGNDNKKPYMKNKRLYLGEGVKQKGRFILWSTIAQVTIPFVSKMFGGKKRSYKIRTYRKKNRKKKLA